MAISHSSMLLCLATALALPAVLLAGVNDKSYDCQLRELAHAYTADVVLGERVGWSTARRANALALVDHGLKLGECNSSSSRRTKPFPTFGEAPAPADAFVGASASVYVSINGSDTASGTAGDPLKTVAGAQVSPWPPLLAQY